MKGNDGMEQNFMIFMCIYYGINDKNLKTIKIMNIYE